MERSDPPRPLEGLKVLDLGRMFAAPYAGQVLGDLGADVIKVEQPAGDEMRHYGPIFLKSEDGEELLESTYSLAANRNKRSVVLDLTQAEGRAAALRLAAWADVVLENFKVGGLARYGLDYEAVRKINPGVVYCSVTAFGQDGPYARQAGVDTLLQAMSGMMTVTGEPDGSPQRIGFIVVDLATGLFAAVAVLAALRERDRNGGVGQRIDLSLFDTAFALLSHRALEWLVGGIEPKRRGSTSSGNIPGRNLETAAGVLTLQAGSQSQFRKLCDALGLPHLADDPRFATARARAANEKALMAILEPEFLKRSAREWYDHLRAVGVFAGPLNTVSQAFADPQVRHRGISQELSHPKAGRVSLVANPIRYSRSAVGPNRAPPLLGADTAEVLAGLGFDERQIRAAQGLEDAECV
jgi:crotonobetainyl-CoA:carnitine CoA-transferase CaiB-like acyl-CoA transferase